MNERGTLLAFVAMILVGGVNAVAVRAGIAELAPFWGAALRFIVAGAIFWVLVVVRRPPLPRGRALVGAFVYGILAFALSYAFVYFGLKEAPAGAAMVVIALVPLLTTLLVVVQRQERFSGRGLAGAIVAAAGIILIAKDQMDGAVPAISILALLGGAVAIAETGVVVKWFPRTDPFVMNAVGTSVGVAFMLALSLLTGEAWALPTQADTWLALAYLATLGSVVVFTLALRVLRDWTASKASYQFLLMPLVTIAIAAVVLDEAPRPAFLVGGAIVLAGVYIGAFSRRIAATPSAATAPAGAPPAGAPPAGAPPAARAQPAYAVVPPPPGC